MIESRRVAVIALCLTGAFLFSCPAQANDPRLKRHQEAAAISHVAHSKARAGNMTLAAQLYQQAWQTDSSVMAYLFSAARCLHKAGQIDKAIATYQKFLSMVTPTDSLYAKANEKLNEARQLKRAAMVKEAIDRKAKLRAVEATSAANKAAEDRAEAARREEKERADKARIAAAAAKGQRQDNQGLLRNVLFAGAAVALIGGGWLSWDADTRAEQLRAEVDERGADGKVIGLSRPDALARQDTINLRLGGGIGLIAAGAVSAIGALLMGGQQDRVSLGVTSTGGLLKVQF